MKVPSRGSDQFNLRLPDGMRDRIALEADKAGRSMNAEIIARLSFTLDSNLSDRETLNRTIDDQRMQLREYINQTVRVITEKNSLAFALKKAEGANRQNVLFLEALCNLLADDVNIPEHIRSFAHKTLEGIFTGEILRESGPEEITSATEEMNEIARDVKENARSRAESDPWAQAFGNNGYFITNDISQRDPTKIPDGPETNGDKRKK
ncbi:MULTISPECIES: Arc family DNA-binding protein [Agrobacterium]|uniref:Arc family DNA-binding protein n=1 Tax=Agrobacterium TaxID=357 RepID=UPI0009CD6ED6|nr:MULTISPECIES: Arc family DNA-binding protein [Agrobacterium]QCL72129.1 Arc family DNA-binding protein [Agrobacterium tumefaciens]CUX23932.1 hypothetical protein AGR6A_Cc150159 [Agrobacterium sp. NCPPB 925]